VDANLNAMNGELDAEMVGKHYANIMMKLQTWIEIKTWLE